MRTMRKRRRQENKTDYKARLVMLKSGMPRIVFRKTNKYIIGQLIESKEAQDRVVLGIDSRELLKYGWLKSKSIKNMAASYLAGFLLGKKIIDKEGGISAIFDIGLQRNIAKSREYSFLKGVIDAGIKIKCNEKMFPDNARISGKHLRNQVDVDKIKQKIEKEA